MRKLKGAMRGSKLSTRRFIPWFGLPQRRPTSTLLKHSRRVSLPGNQVSSLNTITVTLIPIFTKGDCSRRRGLRPPHNVVDAAPHQAGGSWTCRRATNAPRRPAQRNTRLVHSKTSHKAQHLALTLSKELILALTLTKLVLSLRI